MKENIKTLVQRIGIYKLYSWLVQKLDDIRSNKFDCCLGDILLLRDVPNDHQLLLTSRLLDVEEYLEKGNDTFPFQNAISYKAFGKSHREDAGNKAFKALIESYIMNGYQTDSYITLDSDMILLDGNHRMGLQIYERIKRVSASMLKRKVSFEYGGDWYYRVGLSTSFMEKLYNKYAAIQKWLIDSGMTFCAISDVKGEEQISLINDIKHLATVLKVQTFYNRIEYRKHVLLGGVQIQFSCMQPEYVYDKGLLISKRAKRINDILASRFFNNIVIVSINCMEGMEMFNTIVNQNQDSPV